MIARYPKFSKISLKHQAELASFTNAFEPYSDFNFTSLLSWDTDGSTQLSTLNDNLIICLPDYLTGEPCYSLIGANNIDETIEKLFEKLDTLCLVPGIVVDNMNSKKNWKIIQTETILTTYTLLVNLQKCQAKILRKKE
jgi:hypothetical protein